jgi:PhnB protein
MEKNEMTDKPTFVPMLIIPRETFGRDMEFYTKAFGAIEQKRWSNEDASVHVSEMKIADAVFHFHEESEASGRFAPDRFNGVTTVIGLFVPDVDLVMNDAIAAGAKLISPAQDYDYGYRQGDLLDPFGHQWTIQKKI